VQLGIKEGFGETLCEKDWSFEHVDFGEDTLSAMGKAWVFDKLQYTMNNLQQSYCQ